MTQASDNTTNAPSTNPLSQPVGAADQSKVELRGVSKSYGEEWETEEIIADLSLTVPPGEAE
ncbi:MAG: hypothetical protein ACR2Q4_12015, partial [Geminicoccaceae bacterium]